MNCDSATESGTRGCVVADKQLTLDAGTQYMRWHLRMLPISECSTDYGDKKKQVLRRGFNDSHLSWATVKSGCGSVSTVGPRLARLSQSAKFPAAMARRGTPATSGSGSVSMGPSLALSSSIS